MDLPVYTLQQLALRNGQDKPQVWVAFKGLIYDVTESRKASFEKINALVKSFDEKKLVVYGLTSSPHNILDPFRHDVSAAFPFAYADQTVLKTMIRSNPGIILLKGAQVYSTWSEHNVPSIDDLEKLMK